MDIHLTPAQSALYEEGYPEDYHIEQDIIEDVTWREIHEPVVVYLNTGAVCFAIYKESL